jgi:hypothetical protein
MYGDDAASTVARMEPEWTHWSKSLAPMGA